MNRNTSFGTGLGQKNQKGTVSLHNNCNRIRIRWRYLGKRYSINHSSYNHFNLLEAKKLALQLEQDMIMGCFDMTLMKYKNTSVAKQQQLPRQQKKVPTQKSIIELFETWTIKYRQISFDINVHYRGVWSMLNRWSEIKPEQIVDKLNQETLGSQTYNERLAILRLFAKWLIKTGRWESNPFEDVRPRKNKKTEKPNREPFTVEEIQKILAAIKNNTYSKKCSRFLHSHYYPFIYFIFQTGVRNAEAVGLRVGSVDVTKKVIVIKEVLARTVNGTNAEARVRKETKNGKIRYLPLSDELLAVLPLHSMEDGIKIQNFMLYVYI